MSEQVCRREDEGRLLSPLTELRAHIRILVQLVLLAWEKDEAMLGAELGGHFAGMCLGCEAG